MRNPPWQRDELILALDLYIRLGRKVADDTHPDVVALSELLNALPIHTFRPDQEKFRNANGVALKLANFRAIDQPGTGMSRGNRLEQVVWDEFADDPVRLAAVAAGITNGHNTQEASASVAAADDEDEREFPEGRVLYRRHRARERNQDLVKAKKDEALKKHGKLACEVCTFNFGVRYGDLGNGYIECHHTVPVSELTEGGKTKLADLALVCANCHRMLHRRRPWLALSQLSEVLG
jgi:5-methylcytosine-specific restriction protein A